MSRDDAVEVLRRAGWFEGRRVPDDVDRWERELSEKGGFVLHEPARDFLLEYGGLAWPLRPEGGRLSQFAFDLDPLVAVFEDDRFDAAGSKVGDALYPVGEVVKT